MNAYKKCYFCGEYAKQENLVEVVADSGILDVKSGLPVLQQVSVCSLCKRVADERSKK